MPSPSQLLARLDAIGVALDAAPGALALIGLGSVGAETDRLDVYSDLDFFVIVAPGHKPAFLADLGWCAAAAPLAFSFMNTVDGYKLLFEDGIFCEFAVFEPAELAGIPFAAARIVWHRPEFDPATVPERSRTPGPPSPTEWLLGEALTNLLIGMARYRRGERLSALRFIQGYALDRLIDLAARDAPAGPARRDPFAHERRLEARTPELAALLPDLAPGYTHTPAAALAILGWLEARYPLNVHIVARIRALCDAEHA